MAKQRNGIFDLALNFELWPAIPDKKLEIRQNNVQYEQFAVPDVVGSDTASMVEFSRSTR